MWILITLLFMGDGDGFKPEPINAQLFLTNGRRVELADIQVKGLDPYGFNFHTGGNYAFINLLQVSRIRITQTGEHELLMEDVELQVGRISTFSISGKTIGDKPIMQSHNIRSIDRIHIIAGPQLRSCFKGHYERHTPHPYCPVCGDMLNIGPFREDEEPRIALPRHHLLRADPRDQ